MPSPLFFPPAPLIRCSLLPPDTHLSTNRPRPQLFHSSCRACPPIIARTAATPSPTPPPPPPASLSKSKRVLLSLTSSAAVAGLLASAPRLLRAYGALGALHPLAGAALVAISNFLCITFCFPANMGLMISAGAALGARNAFFALYVSKLAAAGVTFLLARGIFRMRVEKKLGEYPKIARVLQRSVGGGWRMVFGLRLSPFPGFLLNYLLSVTGVGFWDYLWGTALGILPSIINLVVIGAAGREVAGGVVGESVSWVPMVMKGAMVVSSFAIMGYVSREVKKALEDEEEEVDDIYSEVVQEPVEDGVVDK